MLDFNTVCIFIRWLNRKKNMLSHIITDSIVLWLWYMSHLSLPIHLFHPTQLFHVGSCRCDVGIFKSDSNTRSCSNLYGINVDQWDFCSMWRKCLPNESVLLPEAATSWLQWPDGGGFSRGWFWGGHCAWKPRKTTVTWWQVDGLTVQVVVMCN